MPREIVPDLYGLTLPLPSKDLGTVNAYVVTGADGPLLIDCGWNTPEVYQALCDELGALGIAVADLREILITHLHPDHFGLAARLAEESGAPTMMHRVEAVFIEARYEDTRAVVEEMHLWLRINGVPPGELDAMARASLAMLNHIGTRKPDRVLEGGETLRWGRYSFEVIWTPGHAGGLICLFDRAAGVLLCSDHVLEHISPFVALHAQSLGNPLGDYLDSLRLVRDLPAAIVLPGHGAPFHDLRGRVDELLAHHERRFAEMTDALGGAWASAYDIAARLTWRGSREGWQQLPPFQRRMAVTETIAHLEYLHGRGSLAKRTQGGVIMYGPR